MVVARGSESGSVESGGEAGSEVTSPKTVATLATAAIDDEPADLVIRRALDACIGGTVRLRGARWESIETRQRPGRMARAFFRQPASSSSISSRLPSGRRGGPGGRCIRSFGGGCAASFGIDGSRLSRS